MNILVLQFILPRFFLSKLFSNIFFPNFFQIVFSQFLFKIFFSENFFPNFFFLRFYCRCFPVYRGKTESMYLCYEKYDIQQAVEIGLQSRVIRYSSSVHTAHITLDVKSSIPSPQRIIYYYIFFWNLFDLIEVLKSFLNGI